MNLEAGSIKAVAFDMDGLMFNTEDLYDDVGETLLQRRGFTFERDLKMKMMGRPGKEAFQIMVDYHDLDDSIEQLTSETRAIFAELLPGGLETMPGLFDLLKHLDELGIPKCVATSSHRQFADQALGQFNLSPRFEFVLTADDVERGKPHPDIYLAAAARFQIATESMLVLEDSVTGSTAAAAAGAKVIAIPTSHSKDQDFSHVDDVVESLGADLIRDVLKN